MDTVIKKKKVIHWPFFWSLSSPDFRHMHLWVQSVSVWWYRPEWSVAQCQRRRKCFQQNTKLWNSSSSWKWTKKCFLKVVGVLEVILSKNWSVLANTEALFTKQENWERLPVHLPASSVSWECFQKSYIGLHCWACCHHETDLSKHCKMDGWDKNTMIFCCTFVIFAKYLPFMWFYRTLFKWFSSVGMKCGYLTTPARLLCPPGLYTDVKLAASSAVFL